ncbi:MAG TPA: 50S ribosomal protein L23 [Candidatus Omnitrophota bacterium]|jgi:large subunit ribosomal protein L23|nr:50S ribosomal protein L23 [Candidatus Omnitrophota bacterium]HRZ15709.1 50S ribosomal protein L23 [Candidatus Omnitrophota bacterium]
MKTPYEIIKGFLKTEKSTGFEALNKYMFLVRDESNKTEIKMAVEKLYKVKVKSVNTTIVRGKPKRVRYQIGKTPDFKKALVTLQEGHKIETA